MRKLFGDLSSTPCGSPHNRKSVRTNSPETKSNKKGLQAQQNKIDEKDQSSIRNIALKNWATVDNASLRHDLFAPEFKDVLAREVAKEWQAVEREGKGQNNRGRIGRRGVGNSLQGHYCFLGFLLPPDGRKNPDWSDLMNYPIRHSNWSETCHSKASVFSDSIIQHSRWTTHVIDLNLYS